jgi:hypothetical protein
MYQPSIHVIWTVLLCSLDDIEENITEHLIHFRSSKRVRPFLGLFITVSNNHSALHKTVTYIITYPVSLSLSLTFTQS